MTLESRTRRWAFSYVARATMRDLDGVGHVNHAVYLSWFEEARTHWIFERLGLSRVDQFAFVLASIEAHFRAPVYLHERVEIRLTPVRVGGKSWDLAYEGRALDDGRLVVEGRSTQVQFDYETRSSIPLAGEWLRVIAEELSA